MAYHKILAAIQSTGGKSFVFENALEITRMQKASLLLYHCMETETFAEQKAMTVSQAEISRIERALSVKQQDVIEHQQAWMESLCLQARKEGIEAQCRIEHGHIGKRIIETSRHWGSDLIVMGRTRRGSFTDCLFGTVSDYVIHHATCSLLLVQ